MVRSFHVIVFEWCIGSKQTDTFIYPLYPVMVSKKLFLGL